MSLISSHYHQLYTPEDAAVVFIDHQPQMTFGVANINRADLINNVTLLAKAAKLFQVPTVITAVETEGFSGYVWPQLLDIFPGQHVIERTSMNFLGFRRVPEGHQGDGPQEYPPYRALDGSVRHVARH